MKAKTKIFFDFSLSLGVNRPLRPIKLVSRTWFSLEQVFGLERGDVGHCSKHVCAVDGRSLYTVSVVYTSISSLLVDVKLQINSFILYTTFYI